MISPNNEFHYRIKCKHCSHILTEEYEDHVKELCHLVRYHRNVLNTEDLYKQCNIGYKPSDFGELLLEFCLSRHSNTGWILADYAIDLELIDFYKGLDRCLSSSTNPYFVKWEYWNRKLIINNDYSKAYTIEKCWEKTLYQYFVEVGQCLSN